MRTAVIMAWLRFGRKPIRCRRTLGPLTVNTSDLRVTSTTFKADPVSRNSRRGWKVRLPFGFYIMLGGRR